MKRYIITTVLDVEDTFDGKTANIEMVKRYLAGHAGKQIIDEPCYRGRVAFDVIDLKSEVFEL